jgi:Fic family protein
MKRTNKNTLSRVEALERDLVQQKLDARIPGSFTSEEYAQQTGRSPITARTVLFNLVESGHLKRVKVPKLLADGRVQMVHGYVVVEKNSQ